MLAPGFAHAVYDSQSTFRHVMDALANPGDVHTIDVLPGTSTSLPRAAAATLLALCDFETAVYLSPALNAQPGIVDYIRFHTGCEITDDPSEAMFAVVDPVADRLRLEHFAQGTPEYPDRSTTVIVLCRTLDTGPDLVITGPGVRGSNHLAPAGLPADFVAQMAINRAGFPLGVDVVLVAGDVIAGLPRSVRVVAGER